MLFRCCKLREWVWTKTGKGDRLGGGGDGRFGPSPFSERPAPPHSLQNLTGPDQRPASFICRPVFVLHLLVRICHALLPAFALPPCLLALGCICPHVTIQPFAPEPSLVLCKDCPAGSHTTWTALRSPCFICIQSILCFVSIHSKEPGTALSSRLPPCSCKRPLEMACGTAHGLPC